MIREETRFGWDPQQQDEIFSFGEFSLSNMSCDWLATCSGSINFLPQDEHDLSLPVSVIGKCQFEQMMYYLWEYILIPFESEAKLTENLKMNLPEM